MTWMIIEVDVIDAIPFTPSKYGGPWAHYCKAKRFQYEEQAIQEMEWAEKNLGNGRDQPRFQLIREEDVPKELIAYSVLRQMEDGGDD